jgi:hypothetical protein
MLEFDPIRARGFWLQRWLKRTIDSEPYSSGSKPPSITHISQGAYAEMQTSRLIDGYLYGFANELNATVEKHIAWMESYPEPDRVAYAEGNLGVEAWREALFSWRLMLGVCKWLGRGEPTFGALTAAAATDWQVVALVDGELAPDVRASRRYQMSLHFATALAADAPLLGLKIYEAAGMRPPMGPATLPTRFGHWACQHLLGNGTRDETFVARGKAMLTANLLPIFLPSGDNIQVALWLKAIYFDSGAVQTPEQAIAKAYDSTPGIPRPDFIPA